MNKTEQNSKAIKSWYSKNKTKINKAIKADEHPDKYAYAFTIDGTSYVLRHDKKTKKNYVRFSTTDFIEVK